MRTPRIRWMSLHAGLRAGLRAGLLANFLALALTGCGVQTTLDAAPGQVDHAGQPSTPSHLEPSAAQPSRPIDRVTIGSFNIQVFGQSKLDKPEVVDVLARVARRFDVLAIQEVRSKEQDVLPRLIERINADGSHYDFLLGPRLGRTSSKEQYAFVYDTTRIELLPNSVYTVDDPYDRLHRPPLVAGFRTLAAPATNAFTFTLVNIHTDPDETDTELDALADVFVAVQRDGRGEDDVILLGDLNVSPSKLGQLGRLSGIAWTVDNEPTNTRLTRTYDNLVFDRRTTVEFTGVRGVLNLMSEFGLSTEQALEVSDHLPVWAEFSTIESQGPLVAIRPDAVNR